MIYHHHYDPRDWYQPIVKGDFPIEFGIVRLVEPNQNFRDRMQEKEGSLIILGGKCSIMTKDYSFPKIGQRESVFKGRATGLYLPPHTSYEIKADTSCEVAICKVKAKKRGKPVLITPDKVKCKSLGKDNFRRNVYHVIDERIEAEHILAGETINKRGNWSSYPPHKHDVDNLPFESKQVELYFFRLDPPDGFGVIRLYNKKRDKIFTIKNNDVVIIPDGYHPVGVISGYRIYYHWILAGEKRILRPREDPRYSWVNKGRK